jgi:hypothetical protein
MRAPSMPALHEEQLTASRLEPNAFAQLLENPYGLHRGRRRKAALRAALQIA